jgi:hypothetical protein
MNGKTTWLAALAWLAVAFGGATTAARLWHAWGETRPAQFLGNEPTKPSIEQQQAQNSGSWSSSQPPLLPYIPTYYQHVAPILHAKCTLCHSDNNIAPFGLDNPQAAIKHARQVQFAVQDKRMPPWMPSTDSPKMRDELKLSDEDIAIIANWAWAGAPLGKTKDAAPLTKRNSDAQPDLVVDMGYDFEPSSKFSDEYRCFILDPKNLEERYLAGYGIRPGNASVVHHVLLFQITGDYVRQARALEAQDDGRGGYTCFGGPRVGLNFAERFRNLGQPSPGSSLSFLGSWVPGSGRVDFPQGVGLKMEPGSAIVMQVHYNLLAGKGRDRTQAQFYLAPRGVNLKPLRLFAMVAPVEIACGGDYPASRTDPCHRDAAYERVAPYQEPGMNDILQNNLVLLYCQKQIDAYLPLGMKVNDPKNRRSSCDYKLSSDRWLLGVQGHMHLLGKSIRLELNPDSKASTLLVDIPKWDFHWQGGYWYKEAIAAQKGEVLRISCTHDNSPENQPWIGGKQQQPRYVVWGEGTSDEMCVGAVMTTNR